MSKQIVFTTHARQRMKERGVKEADVIESIGIGMREPAQRGLYKYKLNIEFNNVWCGHFYGIQQVVPIVAEEDERFVVITVYAFYFQQGDAK